MVAGHPVQFRAAGGEQFLVGGDHGLAGRHCGQQQRAGRLEAARELDHDVGVRLGHQGFRVGGQQRGGPGQVLVLRRLADRDARHLELRPGPRGQVRGLLAEQPVYLRADRPAAQQDDAQRRKLTPRHGGRSPPPALCTALSSGST